MKTALCTTLAEVYTIRNVRVPTLEPIHTLNLTTEVKDRAFCENDVNDQQLLPYLVTNRIAPVKEAGELRGSVMQYFMYRRGKAGAESKLHDKLSIGLGGHVDVGVPEDEQSDQPFLRSAALNRLLQREAAREYEEECGVKVDPDNFRFSAFIIDPLHDGNALPVAAVHLGLLSVLNVSHDQGETMTGEGAVCVDPQWKTLNELMSPEIYGRLETWSRLVVDALYAMEFLSPREMCRYQSHPTGDVSVQDQSWWARSVQLPAHCHALIPAFDVYKLPEPKPNRPQAVADAILTRFIAEADTWPVGVNSANAAITLLERVILEFKTQRYATEEYSVQDALAELTVEQLHRELLRIPLKSKHVCEVTVESPCAAAVHKLCPMPNKLNIKWDYCEK